MSHQFCTVGTWVNWVDQGLWLMKFALMDQMQTMPGCAGMWSRVLEMGTDMTQLHFEHPRFSALLWALTECIVSVQKGLFCELLSFATEIVTPLLPRSFMLCYCWEITDCEGLVASNSANLLSQGDMASSQRLANDQVLFDKCFEWCGLHVIICLPMLFYS